ncbi:MAG: hypothetical protein KGP28_06190 [Bdellovibrionales bacterium]|nr:hypothetical protein [Bdellovibrionales bacterium]
MTLLLKILILLGLPSAHALNSSELTTIDGVSWESAWEYASMRFSCGYEVFGEADVIHVPQIHDVSFLRPKEAEQSPLNFLAAGISQYHVAQLLQKNPDSAIFAEGGGKGIDAACASLDWTKKAFPGGVIPPMSQLSKIQVEVLVELGAPCLLRSLGLVKRLEETEKGSVNLKAVRAAQRLIEKGKNENRKLKLEKRFHRYQRKREKLAIEKVVKFKKKNPGKKVLIVYGAGHDLSDGLAGFDYERAEGCESLQQLLASPDFLLGSMSETIGTPPFYKVPLDATGIRQLCLDADSRSLVNARSIESKIQTIFSERAEAVCPVFGIGTGTPEAEMRVDCEIEYQGVMGISKQGANVCLDLKVGAAHSRKTVKLQKIKSSENLVCSRIAGPEIGSVDIGSDLSACSSPLLRSKGRIGKFRHDLPLYQEAR